jgi:hypothetical protein
MGQWGERWERWVQRVRVMVLGRLDQLSKRVSMSSCVLHNLLTRPVPSRQSKSRPFTVMVPINCGTLSTILKGRPTRRNFSLVREFAIDAKHEEE